MLRPRRCDGERYSGRAKARPYGRDVSNATSAGAQSCPSGRLRNHSPPPNVSSEFIVYFRPEPLGRLAFRWADPILVFVHFHRDPDPSVKELARWVKTLGPELHRRYGLEGGCTHQQVAKTAADLGIGGKILPYMYAAFVHEDELPAVRAQMPEVNWEEVDERSSRVIDGLQHTSHYDEEDGFRESWKGITG